MKLLIFASRFSWPLDKGDKLRMYHQIKYLSTIHDVYFLALSDTKVHDNDRKELLKFCKEVYVFKLSKPLIFFGLLRAFFRAQPLQVGYFYSKRIANDVNKTIFRIKPDYIYGQLVRVAEYIKNSDIHKCLDLQDALSAGLKRRYNSSNIFLKPLLKLEYKRMLEYEAAMKNHFDSLTIITETDRQLLPVQIREIVNIIPNGVDFSFFDSEKINVKSKFDIVFTGNMNYPPNIKASQFLVKEIMPIVWKSSPNSKVLIAGSSPHSTVKSLMSELVEVSGWIDDIRVAYKSAKVFVAPMQIGTGLQNKLLEAMAMGLPCVTSDLANNALQAVDGEHIFVAPKDSAAIFAMKIIDLLSDTSLANRISFNGNMFVKHNYDWQNAVSKLNSLFEIR